MVYVEMILQNKLYFWRVGICLEENWWCLGVVCDQILHMVRWERKEQILKRVLYLGLGDT